MIDEQIRSLADHFGVANVVTFDQSGDEFVAGALHWASDALRQAKVLEIAAVLCRFANMPPAALLALSIDVTFRPFGGGSGTNLPLTTWTMLLENAGFEILDVRERVAVVLQSNFPSSWLERYWNDADLFRQGAMGLNQRLLVCRRTGRQIDAGDLVHRVDATLDVSFLRAKRSAYAGAMERPIVLNIHQIQDYLNLRPIIDLLDPANTIPLIREHSEFRPLKRLSVIDDLRRRGFSPRLYRHIDDLDWSEFAGKPLLSATESAITTGHALSRHLVEVAKWMECPTFLLQHGAWVESFPSGPVSFGSREILAWGEEHAQSFAAIEKAGPGKVLPRGATPSQRFKAIGSPKFADMLMRASRANLMSRLGIAESAFGSITMLGTNLHWGRHTDKVSFFNGVAKLTKSRREDFFIIKTHPAESFYDYEILRDENVLVYDDTLALATDFHTPRLLQGVDHVLSSLSSLLVDASVIGLPVVQYDTGNSIRYSGMQPLPCSALTEVYTEENITKARTSAETLAATYAGADHAQFYSSLIQLLDCAHGTAEDKQDGLSQMSAYGLIENAAVEHQKRELRIADIEDVLASGLFDEAHYTKVAGNLDGASPIEHFLTYGGWNGLDPHAAFASHWYSAQHAVLQTNQIIPLLHYIRVGAELGYDPHILFRTNWYVAHGGSIPPGMTPLRHYLFHGEALGISCHPLFDPEYYARSVNTPCSGSLLEHFITSSGETVGDPSPSFSCSQYLQNAPDVKASQINPLLHYLHSGAGERRIRSDVQRIM